MPKIDFLSLESRAVGQAAPHQVKDAVSGMQLEIWLRPLRADEQYVVSEQAQELVIAVEGDEKEGIAPTRSRLMVPNHGPVKASYQLVHQVGMVAAMQEGASEEHRYSFDQLLACAIKTPTVWAAILRAVSKVQREASPDPKPLEG